MSKKYDVVIVGGGPVGLHTGKLLAENGVETIILEKKPDIGLSVICTGIVSQDVFRQFNLSGDSILREIQNVKVVSPFGTSLSYQHPQPFAYVVDREKFDKNLAAEARDKGVDLRLERKVVDLIVSRDSVDVSAQSPDGDEERYSAKLAVLATGVDFSLNKKTGLGYPKRFLNGVQIEMMTESIDCPTIFIGRDFAPGAFAWAVPLNGQRSRVGLAAEGEPRSCFHNFLSKFFPEKLGNGEEDNLNLKPIAQGLVSKTYGDKVIVVGEAAGQVKTTTGGGIAFGLLCSEIAGRVISQSRLSGSFSSRSLADYERQWRKAIQREIIVGYYARQFGARLNELQIERMFQIARSDGIIPMIKKDGNFDWQADLIFNLMRRFSYFRVF